MKKRINRLVAFVMSVIILITGVFVLDVEKAEANVTVKPVSYEYLYVPSYAAMSGKMLYYAVGMDYQGGRLYMYNTATKKQKKISDLRCADLTVTKNYIFCTVNKYIGSDGIDRFIYRMSKDGKKAKALAYGYSPVVVGKYIYYIGVKKSNINGMKSERSIGIYRMDANGGHKKCVLKFNGKTSCEKLVAGKNRVIFSGSSLSTTFALTTSGKLSRITLSTRTMRINTYTRTTPTAVKRMPISHNKYGLIYMVKGRSIVKYKGTDSRKIFTLPSKYANYSGINTVIDCGKYLFITANYQYAFVVSKNGTGAKKVANTMIGY